MPRRKHLLLLLLLPLGALAWWLLRTPEERRERVRIAYIGRYTDQTLKTDSLRRASATFDRLHETALRDMLARIGDELKLDIDLVPFANRRDPKVSDSIYRNVVAPDTSFVAVIDNTWGAHLLPSAETIRQRGIPLIAMNADRNNGDFGQAALFSGNDDDVPVDIATYLHDVLRIKRIASASESDYGLHPVFLRELAARGITVDPLITLVGADVKKDTAVERVIGELVSRYLRLPKDQRPPLVVNTHGEWGNRLLAAIDSITLREKNQGVTVIGGAYIAGVGIRSDFGRHTTNSLIIMSRPVDALPGNLADDLERYRRSDPEDFGLSTAPFFLKRCRTTVEVIRHLLTDIRSDSATAPITRSALRTSLAGLRGGRITGDVDLYRFDSTLTLLKEQYFTRQVGGKLLSMPLQLNSQRTVIPNMFFGMEVLDIFDIEVGSNSFKADFFYWVKLDTARPDVERTILFRTMKAAESNRELVMEKRDGATLYRLYKVSGAFHNKYAMTRYPLDRQVLAIPVDILNPSEEVRISFDASSLEVDSALLDRFSINAWVREGWRVTVDNRITAAMRGDPERMNDDPTAYKTFTFSLTLRRKFAGPFLQIILPLVLIGMVAISTLYVKDISFENLGEVSVGTFLGIITFSIALSSLSPGSDTLTRADLLFWATFMVVLVSFLTIIVINSRWRLDELAGVSIRPVAIGLTVIYPLAVLGILLG